MQFDERINLEIMERFAEADIKLALPAIKNYLSREDEQSVKDLTPKALASEDALLERVVRRLGAEPDC